ncbi:MAG: PEP-CTERM sorting domain-containing protein [Phycisphaerales bacterium]|nr:PEP-CTERM sorting domain-containing protein [Phycisphaerales bacterium]
MKSIALLAVAGLATVASAQNISTNLVIDLSWDKAVINVGETATATITASWTGVTGSYFSSFNVNLLGSDQIATVDSVANIAWNNPALGFNGTYASLNGANIIGLQASQFSLIPPFVTTNPILVTTFTVTGTAEGVLSYSTTNAAGAPFPFSVTGPVFSDPVVEFGHSAFQSGSLTIVPAPSAMALLGLGGLMAGRRRR